MSIYLDEKNPGKHKPFEDASPDIVEYVRYLEVIAGKSANTAFSYFCDLRGFSRFMKRRRGLVPADSEMQDIDPKGLDTAFWASVTCISSTGNAATKSPRLPGGWPVSTAFMIIWSIRSTGWIPTRPLRSNLPNRTRSCPNT